MKHAVAKCAAKELEAVALEEAEEATSTTAAPKPVDTFEPMANAFPVQPPNFPNAVPISVQPLEGDKALVAEVHIKDNSIRPNFDPEKLQQAILSYRPVSNTSVIME